ncbi:MAG TPA: MupA/Atu3671 family FMN-dependent luciferase-like monooxygenase [Streptosporangiaceae bacterium]|nr:MupA/Atu3671 family FMN-dependent luciferase-like monooxygenase [Streptosporangiaceae bacterium]
MSVVELLSQLRQANVTLWADGDHLRFRAPHGALRTDLKEALAAHKAEVLEFLRRAAPEASAPITAARRDGPVPLSFQQRRMWFFEQVRPGTSTYHMAASWRIRGPLDQLRLRRCFASIVARHEVLRTRFILVGDEPAQEVVDSADVVLPVVDLTALPPAVREAETHCLTMALRQRPFDLTTPPPLRTALLQTGAAESVLVLTVHHIAADMWSAGVMLRELTALYGPGGPASLPELPFQYSDYAAWQRSWLTGDALAGQLEYWRERLTGAPAFLDLPTARQRPVAGSHAAGQRSVTLPAHLVAAMDDLCRRAGVTRFMVLLTAFNVLLARYTGETDIVVGTPVANRAHTGLADLIGFFVNTLVLRTSLGDDPTGTDLLSRVRELALGAQEHQDLPVEQLVDAVHPPRQPGRSPLFQTLFVVQNSPMSELDLPGLTVEALPTATTATEFDLTLEVVETSHGVCANVAYDAGRFDGGGMQRLLGHWLTLLRGLVADPGRRVSELPVLSAGEHDLLIGSWNDTAAQDVGPHVHDRVARQARATPEATAVVFRDREMTYAELASRANTLAGRLAAAGAGRGDVVAVCLERSAELVVSLLGVLQAGAAYLPLDTTLPTDRLSYMLDDASVRMVVTTSAQRHLFDRHRAQVLLVDGTGPLERPTARVPLTDADLAYAIYTSGSTGKPKGVMLSHGALANFLAAMDQVLGQHAVGVWLALTSVSFDISVLELLWPLTRGWTVVVQADGDILPGAGTGGEGPPGALGFSLFYFAASNAAGPGAEPYQLLLDSVKFADQHGFDAVWTPERHLDAFGGPYPNPAVTAAALATVTSRIGLRAGSVVLPLHNPLRVAEEWAVVDNLSGGRAGVSFASGWHPNDFALAPDPGVFERRKEVMFEQIDTVRRLWRGESVTVPNGVGRDVAARTFPRPVQPELPFWVTAAGSPETFQRAGQIGANLLTHLLGQSVEDLAERVSSYRRAWRAAGHPGDGHVTLMVHTYVGSDPARTKEAVRSPFREYLRSSFGLVRALAPSLGFDGEPTEEDVEALLDYAFEHYYRNGALMGTAEECAIMAGRLRTAGVDELACLIDFGLPAQQVLDGLPLLAGLRRRFEEPASAAQPSFGVAAQIRRHHVTHLQCTPSLASILAADPRTRESLAELETLVVGGEALPTALATDLLTATGGRLVNMYGPTETTIWSTSYEVPDPVGDMSVGRPLTNTTTYILDGQGCPVPVGVPGELFIGGHGVARGYLRRPGLTAGRFVPSPFAAGARLYRTGDRARYLPDGRIEFLGRMDRQVKLGGHRLELGEIESVLRGHPSIRHAAVVVYDDDSGHRQLVSYLVGTGEPVPADELRRHLMRKLPEVMVPTVTFWLDELALTTSGKVDYRALPAPAAATAQRAARTAVTARPYVPATDELTRTIAAIWQDVLHVDQVGVRDNFFDLGGHSLMAIQLVSRLRASLGIEVTLRTVFESATIAELAERLSDGAGRPATAGRPALRPYPRDTTVPLSFAQQRVWFFEQMNPGTTAYHLSATLRLRGALRPAALRRAFDDVVSRHEALRTNFSVADRTPVQTFTGERRVPMPIVDLTCIPQHAREHEVSRLALEAARRSFDLECDALLRTTLLHTAAGSHVLLLTMHHIVSDSWSIGVMVGELGARYEAHVSGRAGPLAPLPIQYADYTLWQRDWLGGEVLEEQLRYWRDALEGAPPVLALPLDRPRTAVRSHVGAQVRFELGPDLSARVRALSQSADVTVFVTLLAAFNALLSRWAHEDHVVVGVPVAGRGVPELEPVIGFLANTTVMHTDLTGDPRFTDLMARVRSGAVGAYDHQDLPVEKLVADLGVTRAEGQNPLFQVMFVFTNDMVMLPALGDVEVEPLDVHQGQVFMDLNMAMEDGPGGLRGTLDYSSELFDAATIDWLLERFLAVLSTVTADPGTRVSELPVGAGRPTADVPVAIGATFTAAPVQDPLRFWVDQLGLPVSVNFAPYNQLFQELLAPGSLMAANRDGINVALLRKTDWEGPQSSAEEVGEEFASALSVFQRSRHTPFLVALCPSADPEDEPALRWRSAMARRLSAIDHVICLDIASVLDRYGVTAYLDPVRDEAGHIPYTDEFFAVLGTCLARQVAALVSGYPTVFVVDGDRCAAHLDQAAGNLLAEALAALARRGRRVWVCTGADTDLSGLSSAPVRGAHLVADARPLRDKIDAIVAETAVPPGGCALLTSGGAAGQGPPGGVIEMRLPSTAPELAEFLTHTWLFDPPGAPTPVSPWWDGGRR